MRLLNLVLYCQYKIEAARVSVYHDFLKATLGKVKEIYPFRLPEEAVFKGNILTWGNIASFIPHLV